MFVYCSNMRARLFVLSFSFLWCLKSLTHRKRKKRMNTRGRLEEFEDEILGVHFFSFLSKKCKTRRESLNKNTKYLFQVHVRQKENNFLITGEDRIAT